MIDFFGSFVDVGSFCLSGAEGGRREGMLLGKTLGRMGKGKIN